DPPRGKTQNDKMPFDAALRVAHDHVALAGEPDRLDLELRLLTHLAHHGVMQGLAKLHGAARQRVEVLRRHARAPHHQHFAVADDGGADREIRPIRIGADVAHVIGRCINPSMTACIATVSWLSGSRSPLMTAAARAINGLRQVTACAATKTDSAEEGSAPIALRVVSRTTVMVTANASRNSRKPGSAAL